jgi:hypothetical protein
MHKRKLFILFLFALVSGCATTPEPMLIQQSSVGGKEVISPDWTSVLIMPPLMDYKDVRTEKELPPNLYGGQATARNITEAASRSIRGNGFNAFEEKDLAPDQKKVLDEVLKDFGNQVDEWAKKSKEKTLPVPFFQKLRDETNAEVVLFNLLKAKIGEGAYGFPGSGAIAPGASTSHLVAFLVDIRTGNVVWRNELFLRERPDTKIFNESLEMLFSKLPAKKKEGTR